MNIKILASLCFLLCLNMQAQVIINEFMAINTTTIVDEDGEYVDWIELYNTSSQTVNLNGWHLSDDDDQPVKWTFPNVSIGAGDFLVVFASGKDRTDGELHTNFSIKSTGEVLYMTDEDGGVIDFVTPQLLSSDQSYGRIDEDEDDYEVFSEASPGEANSNGMILMVADHLVINEFMSKNDNVLEDEDGEYPDWIEIYNATDEAINLSGYRLTDDPDSLTKWTFPSVVLGSQDYLVVFASGKDKTDNELHTNFSIKASGEPLYLMAPAGFLVDYVEEQSLLTDQSYGRLMDGGNAWANFVTSTPNASNNGSVKEYDLIFSHEPGQYTAAFDLEIYASDEIEVFYTLDGSDPTPNDDEWTGSIEMESREGDPNVYSEIQSAADDFFELPEGEVFKINIVRARAYQDGVPVSKIYTRSYMIDPDLDRYELSMISLVTDPDNLFNDEYGIYVPGSNYDGESENSMNCFQSGKAWERPVHVEFMDEEGKAFLAEDAGLRIHGGGSRRYTQKPLRLYARSEYGERYFEHPFFDEHDLDKYKRLVLRAQNSSNRTFFTDEVASNIISDLDQDRMAVKTHVVFLNGEFWGLYHLRERLDKYYLEGHHDVDTKDVNIIEDNVEWACCIEGEPDDYEGFLAFLENNDLSDDDVFELVEDMMDVDQYRDYLITQFYFSNYDWPVNNTKYWKTNDAGSKWRWMFFDIDFGMRFYERPSFSNYMNNTTSNMTEWATFLGQKLLENDNFKDDFIDRFEELLNTTLSQENVICHINYFESNMEAHMEEYMARIQGNSLSYWYNKIDEAREFAALRPCFLQDQIMEEFGVMIDVGDCTLLENYQAECFPPPHEGEFEVDVKVFLEGPYQNGSNAMHNLLFEEDLIPLSQPYNKSPWNYNGGESTTSLPDNTVDWVLVEMRTGTPVLIGEPQTEVVEVKAGILLTDGHIVDAVKGDPLLFDNLEEGEEYHIVIRHRNHLDIISSETVEATKDDEINYNFTNSQDAVFGSLQTKEMEDGRFVMYGGDFEADGVIQLSDYDVWKSDPATLGTYEQADGNLDSIVQNTDADVWIPNKAKLGTLEIQY